jgi:hypothetical protein
MRARLLLLAAALLAFGASLGSSFHFDDYAISKISANLPVKTQLFRKVRANQKGSCAGFDCSVCQSW